MSQNLTYFRIHKDKYQDDEEAEFGERFDRRGRSNTMASTVSKKREKSRSRFFKKKSTAS